MKFILQIPKNKLGYDGYGILKMGTMRFMFEHHELIWALYDCDVHYDSGFVGWGHTYLDINLIDVVFTEEEKPA